MDKLCLNWSGYDANIREHFRKLREDQRLSDVTLVSDDGQHIQAHKIILSTGSNFFADIFMRTNHSNMLVYLKGISSDKLEPVIDYIYNGEVFITQEQVEVFMETGKELLVKDLEGELSGIAENTTEIGQRYDNYKDEKIFTDTVGEDYDTVANVGEEIIQPKTINEVCQEIYEMMGKNEGVWKCRICGKTGTHKQTIKNHAEIHMEGISYSCHVCSKTFSNRNCLNVHISGIHSELFSCDICGKTGMNRKSYRKHKQRTRGCKGSV